MHVEVRDCQGYTHLPGNQEDTHLPEEVPLLPVVYCLSTVIHPYPSFLYIQYIIYVGAGVELDGILCISPCDPDPNAPYPSLSFHHTTTILILIMILNFILIPLLTSHCPYSAEHSRSFRCPYSLPDRHGNHSAILIPVCNRLYLFPYSYSSSSITD
jgi:hypothetical protein